MQVTSGQELGRNSRSSANAGRGNASPRKLPQGRCRYAPNHSSRLKYHTQHSIHVGENNQDYPVINHLVSLPLFLWSIARFDSDSSSALLTREWASLRLSISFRAHVSSA